MNSKYALKLIVVAFLGALMSLALASCSTAQTSGSSSSEGDSTSSESAASSDASDSSESTDASSSAASSTASDTGTSSASASSSAPASDAMQKMGNGKVGYLQVPATWEDRTSDIDPKTVESYELVYYVDPTSKYSSATLGHDNYAKAIQMTVAPTSYKEIAQGIVDGFKGDTARFGTTEAAEITLGDKNAILITTTMTKDNLQLATIVIDRDGDGHAAVALTMNCGMNATASQEVLQYAKTWTF